MWLALKSGSARADALAIQDDRAVLYAAQSTLEGKLDLGLQALLGTNWQALAGSLAEALVWFYYSWDFRMRRRGGRRQCLLLHALLLSSPFGSLLCTSSWSCWFRCPPTGHHQRDDVQDISSLPAHKPWRGMWQRVLQFLSSWGFGLLWVISQ
jgi:hypothetical protein